MTLKDNSILKTRWLRFLSGLFLMVSLSSRSQVNLTSSLSACYSFNGNTNDPINSLTGTLNSVWYSTDRFNNANSALEFMGHSLYYAELPNSPLLKSGTMSFSGWVYFTNTSADQVIVYTSNGCPQYSEGYQLRFKGGQEKRIQIIKSSPLCQQNGRVVLSGTTTGLQLQVWYHVGFYAGADSLKLFLNGAPDGAIQSQQALSYGVNALVRLGGSGNFTEMVPLYGKLDNLRFYTRKLTNAEMTELYNQDPFCIAGPPVSAFAIPPVLCQNESVTLVNLSAGSPTYSVWDIPGGSPATSTLVNPAVSFSAPGIYSITLTTANSLGASNPHTQTLAVSACTGLSEISSADAFRIFPNPGSGILTLRATKPLVTRLELYDAFGIKRRDYMWEGSDEQQLDLTDLPEGIYFMNWPGNPATHKIVLQGN